MADEGRARKRPLDAQASVNPKSESTKVGKIYAVITRESGERRKVSSFNVVLDWFDQSSAPMRWESSPRGCLMTPSRFPCI